MSRDEQLDTVVVVRCAAAGCKSRLALIQTYCEMPTFGLIDAHGQRSHWRADLTRPATPAETAEYWRARARHAEAAATKNGEQI